MLSEAQFRLMEAVGVVSDLKMHVDDRPALSPAKIRNRLASLKARYPDLAVVAIDYLHIIQPDHVGKNFGHGEQAISEIVLAIRDTCKELGVACLLGSQLNREVSDRGKTPDFRPQLHHLRMSGTIEQYSYCVLGLFREDYYVAKGMMDPPGGILGGDGYGAPGDSYRAFQPTHKLEISILKQQRGPAGVTATITYNPALRQFSDPLSS